MLRVFGELLKDVSNSDPVLVEVVKALPQLAEQAHVGAVLEGRGDAVLQMLRDLLEDERQSDPVRVETVNALALLAENSDGDAGGVVLRVFESVLAESDNDSIRVGVVKALAQLADKGHAHEVLMVFSEFLRRGDSDSVRVEVVKALAQLPEKSFGAVIEIFTEFFDVPSTHFRETDNAPVEVVKALIHLAWKGYAHKVLRVFDRLLLPNGNNSGPVLVGVVKAGPISYPPRSGISQGQFHIRLVLLGIFESLPRRTRRI